MSDALVRAIDALIEQNRRLTDAVLLRADEQLERLKIERMEARRAATTVVHVPERSTSNGVHRPAPVSDIHIPLDPQFNPIGD